MSQIAQRALPEGPWLADTGVLSRLVWAMLWSLVGCTAAVVARDPPRSETPRKEGGQTPSEAAADAGQASVLFRRNCQACHGQDGTGAKARKNMPEIPDFTNADWHAQKSDFRLAASIRDGKGTFMPAFSDRLNDTEVRQLVAYVRSLDPPSETSKTTARTTARKGQPNDFEKRFQKLQDELKALRARFDELSRQP